MKKRKVSPRTTLFMVQSALIAAVYVAVTLAVAPIAFGPVQFRISEALAVLPCFTPAAVPGLFVGCLLATAWRAALCRTWCSAVWRPSSGAPCLLRSQKA